MGETSEGQSSQATGNTARKIFSFWSSRPYPELVAACIAGFRRKNPGWEVIVLNNNDDSIDRWQLERPPNEGALTVVQLSDWYRLAALAKHGGVFLDASTIPLAPVEQWADIRNGAPLQGFEDPLPGLKEKRQMQNWALAAPPNAAFVGYWLDELRRCYAAGIDECIDSAPSDMTEGNHVVDFFRYTPAYLAFLMARQDHETLYRMSPAASSGQPYFFAAAHKMGFNCHAADSFMAQTDSAIFATTRLASGFIKLRGVDRDCVDRPLADYGDESYLGQMLLTDLNSQPDLLNASKPPDPELSEQWREPDSLNQIGLYVFCAVGGTIILAVVMCLAWRKFWPSHKKPSEKTPLVAGTSGGPPA